MKIFLAATSLAPVYGGPAVSVSRLATALAEAGAEVGLWASDGSIQTTSLLPPQLPEGLTRLSGPAAEALEAFSPDILHDNGLWLPHNHALAVLAAKRGVPRVVSTRGMLEPWARRHKKWKKDLAWLFYQSRDLKRAHALHATAAREADHLAQMRLGVRVHMIANGVDIPDLSSFPPAGAAEVRTAVFLGRLYPVKGLPLLIKAWDRLRPAGWRLVLAGPDEAGHKAELEALIGQAGLADIITFGGLFAGAEKTRFLASADLFVLPSYTESFGIAAAEALAHGVPVLTTTGTPWSMLREQDCGWTVEPTVEGIAAGLSDATSCDAKTLRAMGERGRAWMTSEFAWTHVAAQFLSAYRQALT